MNKEKRVEETTATHLRVTKLRYLFLVLLLILLVLAGNLIRYFKGTIDIDNEDSITRFVQRHDAMLRDQQINLRRKEVLGDYCAVVYGNDAKPKWMYVYIFKKASILDRYSGIFYVSGAIEDYHISYWQLSDEPLLVVYGTNPNSLYQSYTVEQGDFTYGRELADEQEIFLDLYYSKAPDATPVAFWNN